MNFKLGRFRIKNFKAIEDEVFDLRDTHAAILDGPNGFGKTSVFDALEVCFTGKIDRISSSRGATSSKAHDCHFLKRNNSLLTVLQLEIAAEDPAESFTIKAEIAPHITGSAASMRRYEEHITRFTAKFWDDTEWEKIDNANLWDRLALSGGQELFKIQHYISQEDTVGFLRNNDESERHKVLAHLFGTSTQSSELAKIDSIKLLATKRLEELSLKISKTKETLDRFTNTERVEGSALATLTPSNQIKYIGSLTDVSSASVVNVSSALEALRAIAPIVSLPQPFIDGRFNSQLDFLLAKRDLELLDLIALGSVKDLRDFGYIKKAHVSLTAARADLSRRRATLDLIAKDNGELKSALLNHLSSEYLGNSTQFLSFVELLTRLRSENTGISRIVQNIQTQRQSLLQSYKNFHESLSSHEVSCPLCGDKKSGQLDQLLDEYHRQEDFFNNLLSDSARKEFELRRKILDEIVAPLSLRLEKRVAKIMWVEAHDAELFISFKPDDDTRFNNMNRLRTWLDNNGIQYMDFVDPNNIRPTDNYDLKRDALKSRILQHKRKIAEDSSIDLDAIKRSYLSLGIQNDNELLSLSIDLINNDIKFCENLLRVLNSTHAQDLRRELDSTSKLHQLTKQKLDSIDQISKTYSQNIKKYEIEVASCIAIPFYIYTAKVLQTRLNGGGIFLKTPRLGSSKEKNPYIRFCSNIEDSHDAWCTMSSGQLAGLVISFALAMNRLYPSKLESILIDDPVQSMDEINMASLVHLLLHEFPEHQLLVSTHERNVSSYMSYKFTHQGRSVTHINMKDRSQL